MKYAEIPYVNKPVSRIVFGTAIPPYIIGGDGAAVLESAVAAGVNTIDTARGYGKAEYSIGDWFEKYGRRDEVVLLTKCSHPDRERKRVTEQDMKEDLATSLEALKTDYIDIYLLHRDDPDVDVSVPLEVFNEMHAQGKIGAFGGSNWSHERIEEANEYADKHNLVPFTVSSPNFGLADQIGDPWFGGVATISGPANEPARAWYRKTGMPVFAYSSLGRGLFSGRLRSTELDKASEVLDPPAMRGYGYPENYERLRRAEILAEKYHCTVPQIAMNWIFTQGVNTFAIASMPDPAIIQSNAEALSLEMTAEDAAWLNLETAD